MEFGQTVRNAIELTDPEDWDAMVRNRTDPGDFTTAFYPNTTKEELVDLLSNAGWIRSSNMDIPSDATAFSAGIPGRLMYVPLRNLSLTTKVSFESEDENGMVSAVVSGIPEQWSLFTIVILRPARDDEGKPIPRKRVVYDFHPGRPLKPSQVMAPELIGQTMSPYGAMKLGFEIAKIKSP